MNFPGVRVLYIFYIAKKTLGMIANNFVYMVICLNGKSLPPNNMVVQPPNYLMQFLY